MTDEDKDEEGRACTHVDPLESTQHESSPVKSSQVNRLP